MNKLFTDEAWADYIYWFNTDKKVLTKINDLIKKIYSIFLEEYLN